MAMSHAETALAGLRVLVCRPEPKASALCAELARRGAQARALPMLEIRPLAESAADRALIQDLDQFRHVVIASPIAADLALERFEAWWPQWPTGQDWYAVGPGTAERLARAGLHCATPAQGHDSENLLKLHGLQHIKDDRVLICSGRGGRMLLAEMLGGRGARVDRLALYERMMPDYPAARIEADLTRFDPQAIVALSGETLNNLLRLGQNKDAGLRQRLVVVPTERVAAQARQAGFARARVPPALDPVTLADDLAAAWPNLPGRDA